MLDEKTLRMVEGFLQRAGNKREEAKSYLNRRGYGHYAESVSASQECMELSIKSIFLLLQAKYPKTHEFTEEQFERLLEKVPEELEYLDLPRLYLLQRFWAGFYTNAKYGYEKLAVPAKALFQEEEAKLALNHAEDCYRSATELRAKVKLSHF